MPPPVVNANSSPAGAIALGGAPNPGLIDITGQIAEMIQSSEEDNERLRQALRESAKTDKLIQQIKSNHEQTAARLKTIDARQEETRQEIEETKKYLFLAQKGCCCSALLTLIAIIAIAVFLLCHYRII
jgi:hypothetical protein